MQEMQEAGVRSLGRKIPQKRECQPVPYSCLGKSHGQITLADHSPRGCKQSDTTEETEHSADRSRGRESDTVSPSICTTPSFP